MDKKQIINQLRAAKSAHIKWRSYAQAMVAGIPVSQEQVPVIHTDCAFGKWYYGGGQMLSTLESFSAIEVPHENLHAIYIELYKRINGLEMPGKVAKLKGKHKKPDLQEELHSLLHSLIEMSKTLLTAIELLEQEVMRMEDEALAELI